jgi:hypothetical protein
MTMVQAIKLIQTDRESSIFVSKEAIDVLTEQEIFDVFSQHASGEGNDAEVQRAVRTLDMAQYLKVRSFHETDSGERVVVVSEFTLGATTIDLESDASDAGFTRG